MEHPNQPTVPQSEPEKERQILNHVADRLTNSDDPVLIHINSVKQFLDPTPLAVDSNGFIIDEQTGSYVEPYNFSQSKFRDSDSPADNPLSAYLAPESECRGVILDREKAHITDLHTIQEVEGQLRPIRAEMSLTRMIQSTGMTFRIIFEWSSYTDMITEHADTVISYNSPDDNPLTLSCLMCEHESEAPNWNQEGTTINCPECSTKWNTNSIEICLSCQYTFPFEEMTDEEASKYWTPSCPECNADEKHLHSQDRYTEIEESKTLSDLEDDQPLPHEAEIKQFDRAGS